MLDGNLLGEGGARKEAVGGLGASDLAGEKCCWRVEKAGRWGLVVVVASCWMVVVD